jgi:hypothetical protein
MQFGLEYALFLPPHLDNNFAILLSTDISGDSNPNKINFTKDEEAFNLKLARELDAVIPEAHCAAGYTTKSWYPKEVCSLVCLLFCQLLSIISDFSKLESHQTGSQGLHLQSHYLQHGAVNVIHLRCSRTPPQDLGRQLCGQEWSHKVGILGYPSASQ